MVFASFQNKQLLVFFVHEINLENLKKKKVSAMSKLILYGATISPPSRAVVMLVRALDLDVNIQYMNLLKNDQLKAEFVKVCTKLFRLICG